MQMNTNGVRGERKCVPRRIHAETDTNRDGDGGWKWGWNGNGGWRWDGDRRGGEKEKMWAETKDKNGSRTQDEWGQGAG
jgi:hypothetical protein